MERVSEGKGGRRGGGKEEEREEIVLLRWRWRCSRIDNSSLCGRNGENEIKSG